MTAGGVSICDEETDSVGNASDGDEQKPKLSSRSISSPNGARKPRLVGRKNDAVEAVPDIEDVDKSALRDSLLKWFGCRSTVSFGRYDKNHRVLPWRFAGPSNPDPYAVWISEIMLQQTRVATVIDYYNKWMSTWPTVADLSCATLEARIPPSLPPKCPQEVNQMWAGLGYYRRARMLLEGAKHVVEKHCGVFPSSIPSLKAIPGVGAYTAGAIASIAFGRAEALVDGNVVRLFSRLFLVDMDPASPATMRAHWAIARKLMSSERPGDYNQALMELGATVCTPARANCGECPLAATCRALAAVREGTLDAVTQLPPPKTKLAAKPTHAFVLVINSTEKRPEKGLLASLWAFPLVEAPADAPDAAALVATACAELLGGGGGI